ncbi:MAG: LysR family transcriptional regulator [[Clostridium] aminophilum]|uniref:LysR substrate-binding domain-containing protein n=1 Tax=[Clostridium] aminophilum TaxID=1526 RepID=UPI0026F1E66E|nr:LysR family transcriptional regulator [[Clostridium] aminophilum]MDD6195869.1 LysR family transcriptional regulator [[Clostridium] aminophilum]
MTTNQQMFLYAVEEMNFTRAAEKAFVTQQCLSDHIRRLEKSYDVKLFDRTPHLKLTQAGEILYTSLVEIQKIENNLERAISKNSADVSGTISVGIHVERAHLLFPALYREYHRKYPNVRVTLISEQTPQLLQDLESGKLDMMLGLDIPPQTGYRKDMILEEPVYLFATEKLLQQYLPDRVPGQPWIDADSLSRLPLTCTSFTCAVTRHMGAFLTEKNVRANYVCEIGDYLTQLLLCQNHETAFFCPESFLIEHNFITSQQGDPNERVQPLIIRGLSSKIRVDIISGENRYLPGYAADFRDMLIRQYRDRIGELRARRDALI